eukprot:m.21151 g.21151  ORF g.21151 m.21151 type:complete len:295 (-) comp5660_c0_seq1:70-954(-)
MGVDIVRVGAPTLAVAGVVGVVTLVTCVSITVSNHVYTGGIYPYFSDTGRDPPAHSVFATGLTLAAIGIAVGNVAGAVCYRGVLAEMIIPPIETCGCRSPATVLITAAGFGVLSAPCLALLAIFDTCHYPTLHNFSAYLFFTFTIVGFVCNSIGTGRMRKMAGGAMLVVLRRSVRAKAAVSSVFVLAFLLYLPIGLAVACTPGHVSYTDCIDKGLGEGYCADRRGAGGTSQNETCLWDYEECAATNTLRSSTQHICVVCILLYYLVLAYEVHALPAAASASRITPDESLHKGML